MIDNKKSIGDSSLSSRDSPARVRSDAKAATALSQADRSAEQIRNCTAMRLPVLAERAGWTGRDRMADMGDPEI